MATSRVGLPSTARVSKAFIVHSVKPGPRDQAIEDSSRNSLHGRAPSPDSFHMSTTELSPSELARDICELPQPRGPVTDSLFKALVRSPGSMSDGVADQLFIDDALFGEDTPLALYSLYELHYRGFL